MLKRYLKFYLKIIKFNVSTKMMYKFNFWANLITDINFYAIQIAVFMTIYNNVDAIGSWGTYEMTFFMGTFMIIGSLGNIIFFYGVLNIPNHIRTGTMDLFLVKPINTLFYVSVQQFDFSGIFNFIFGNIVLIYSLIYMNTKVTLLKMIGYSGLVLLMLGLHFTILAIAATASFWFIKTNNFLRLSDELFSFSYKVPGILYRGITKVIFMGIIPYGLMFTIPTKFVVNGLSFNEFIYTLIVCIVFWIILLQLWKSGLKRYNSASS